MQVNMRTPQVLRLLLSKYSVVCRVAPLARTWRSVCWTRWAAMPSRAIQTRQPRQRLCVAANKHANASLHASWGAYVSSIIVSAVAPASACLPRMQSNATITF